MNFEELKALVPYSTGDKLHVLSMSPYKGITLRMPGRHQLDTSPIGGDFVVEVTDTDIGWLNHQFTHSDLFDDIQEKVKGWPEASKVIMRYYAHIVTGSDPDEFVLPLPPGIGGLNYNTFLYAVQCLALAEHRRYPQYEIKGGGRYLPARFAAGIVFGQWDAEAAKGMQKKGRPGVEMLEKFNGKPPTLKELAEDIDKL